MRFQSWIWLTRRDLRSEKFRLLLVLFCLATAGFFNALALHAFFYLAFDVREEVELLFPENRVILKPGGAAMFFLRVDTHVLTDETLAELESITAVEKVYPQLSSNFPVSALISQSMLDVYFETEVILYGVPPEFVESDLNIPVEDFRLEPGKPVPSLLSSFFYDAFNMGFAQGMGLPKVNPNSVMGMEFQLVLGESVMGLAPARTGSRYQMAELSGFTSNPSLMGLTVPIEAMKAWSAELSPGKPLNYSRVHVDLKPGSDPFAFQSEWKAKGFEVEVLREDLERYRSWILGAQTLLFGIISLILLLSGVGIFTVLGQFFQNRQAAWGLHRAMGLSRKGVLYLGMFEIMLVIILTSLIVFLMYFGMLQIFRGQFAEVLAGLTLTPGNPFNVKLVTIGALLGLIVFQILIPGFIFLLPILRRKPVELLLEKNL